MEGMEEPLSLGTKLVGPNVFGPGQMTYEVIEVINGTEGGRTGAVLELPADGLERREGVYHVAGPGAVCARRVTGRNGNQDRLLVEVFSGPQLARKPSPQTIRRFDFP